MTTLCISVHESSQVGEARRVAVRLGESRGLGETEVGRLALVATELAGNLVKHTPAGGEILLRPLDDAGVEILALDRGPGMENVARCMQDGFSTAGSPGTGLGAVSRMADLFQVQSSPGRGTVILARVGDPAPAAGEAALEVGVVCRTKPGQEVCGDGWASVRDPERLVLLVADGLGHGSGAAEASHQAIRSFLEQPTRAPTAILEHMHPPMRATRGAAVAVAEIDLPARVVRFAGVGNINGVVVTATESRSTISHNGIVGHEMRRVQEFSYSWGPGATLVLHSDGISGRWDLADYPGLMTRHPSLIAGVLYRDFARVNDDATVAVVRDPAASGGGVS